MNNKYKFKGAQTPRKENPFEVRKILVHPIISYIYSNYGANPTSRRAHRRDASASLLYRLPSSITRYPDFKMTFYESMRMTFVQVKKALENTDIKLKTNCGKVLVNSLYFRCIDCELQNEAALATVYCPDCFSNSQHEGHRVIAKISGDNPANCDCGDVCVIKEEGFCANHGLANDEEITEAINTFPENMKENFYGVMANVFYALFTLCEEFIKRPDEERKEDAIFNLDQLMEDIVAVIKELYKINPSFKLVISRFLMKTPEEFPQSNMLCHNCHNIKKNEMVPTRRVCECTYLTNLLRYHFLFSRELNTYLTSFFADLLIDTKFRLFFSDCMTRYVNYVFPLDNTGNFECYGLEGLSTQAYTGEVNCQIILENNIDIVMNLIEENIEKVPLRFEELKNQHIATLYGVMNFVHYLPEKKWAGKYMVQKTETVERLIQAVSSLQSKHLQYIIEYSPPFVLDGWNYNVAAFSRELELSAQIFRTLNMIFTSMSAKNFEMKKSIQDAFKTATIRFLQEKEDLKAERKKAIDYTGDTSITLHQMIQRLFVFLMGHSLFVNNQQISFKNITAFIEETIGHPERSLATIATTLVKEGLKCIGALSYLTLATTIDNFSVSYHYYLPSSPFYYYDMLAIQIFSALLPSNKIFKTFWKYFFVLDESTTLVFDYFFENDWTAVDVNDVRRIRSFFEFLSHFLSTELPLLNSLSSLVRFKADTFNQTLKSVHNKSLALILQKFSNQYIDVQTVKSCADLVMADQLNHTDRLTDICDVEKKTGKVKLKTEYKEARQSYYFADSRVEKEVAQSFTENFPEKDIIDSYNFKTDFDVLITLREKFFEGELCSWISKFYLNFREEWTDFLPHIMKITLLGLDLLRNKTENKQVEASIKLTFIENKEFSAKLEEIEKSLTEKGLGSLTLSLKRIREVIVQCGEVKVVAKTKEEQQKQGEDEDEAEAERKRKIKQRQLEIQKQFQKKQATFVQNMKPDNQKAYVEEKKKDEEGKKEAKDSHVCHFCREAIDLDGNDYGVPIYVGKCNINFSEKEVRSQDNLIDSLNDLSSQFYQMNDKKKNAPRERTTIRSRSCFSPSLQTGPARNDIMKLKHYPFITSCMHMAHIKCHENYIRDIDDEEAYFFCAYCKSTYNCLLTKSNSKTLRDPRKATVKLSDSQRVPLPFTKTFIKAAGVMPSPSGSISVSQLSYLVHLLLVGFIQVTKNKSLYDLESFMAKRYLPYKLLFDNVIKFMKDYSKCFRVDFGETIFSLFYKTIYELESKFDIGTIESRNSNTPPSKIARNIRNSFPSPNYALAKSTKKQKGIICSKPELGNEANCIKSPIKSLIYQDKSLSSNSILQQLQSSRIKTINTKTKMVSALAKVNKKTIPEKRVEPHSEKDLSPIVYSLTSLDPTDPEISSYKHQITLLVQEDLEETLQKEVIKAMKARASDVEIKKILSYGVFLGTLQIITKVLCSLDETIEFGTYQDIVDQVKNSEFVFINFKDEFIIFLERLLTISFMAFNIKEAYKLTEKIQEIVANNNNEEKYIDMLLSIFDTDFNLNFILSEGILDKLKIEDAFVKAWQLVLSETLACDIAKAKTQSLNSLPNLQLVVDLPDNYLDFNTEYISKKCDLCRGLSVNNHSAICLQCGIVFCLSPCSSKNPYGDNLCDHANTEHKGECIGLCIQTCEIILVCSKVQDIP